MKVLITQYLVCATCPSSPQSLYFAISCHNFFVFMRNPYCDRRLPCYFCTCGLYDTGAAFEEKKKKRDGEVDGRGAFGRAGSVISPVMFCWALYQGRGGGVTNVVVVTSSFRWTHAADRFVFKFFLLFSFLSRSQEAGRNGSTGSGEKRGAEAQKRLVKAAPKCNMCLCNAQW